MTSPSTRAGWVVLVDRGEDHYQPFVTAWCADGENSWYEGHYFESKQAALRDFHQRCERGF
tara:strand:+ start:23643 stop:23825 length:183 start_codon:yes stop_codon:yes gene_type:complete